MSIRLKVVVGVVVSVMLAWALNDENPYWYYQLLRWAVFGAFAGLAWQALNDRQVGAMVTNGAVALLYNPIGSFHFPRETWEALNAYTIGVLFLMIALSDRVRRQKVRAGRELAKKMAPQLRTAVRRRYGLPPDPRDAAAGEPVDPAVVAEIEKGLAGFMEHVRQEVAAGRKAGDRPR